MGIKNFSVRMDGDLLNKLHLVANFEGRSVNSQICVLVKRNVEQYEKEHGKIQLGEK